MCWFIYISCGTYNLKFKFFEKLRVFARYLLRGNRRRNTFCIWFWCLAWGTNPGFTYTKPTLHLLDHGAFSKYFPLRSIHFCMRLYQLSKHFCHSDCGIFKIYILKASTAFSSVKKKSFSAKSGLYGRWLTKS